MTTIKLLSIAPRADRTEYVSRIYPRATGITLADTTRTAAAPYVLNKTEGYISNSTAETTIGRVDRAVSLPIDTPSAYISLHLKQGYAADALFDAALEWLGQHDTIADFFTIRVRGLTSLDILGKMIHVKTNTYVNGEAAYVVDDDFNVLSASWSFDDGGELVAELEITSIERQAVSDAQVLANTVMRSARQAGGISITGSGGSGSITLTAGADISISDNEIAREGTSILLFSSNANPLREYERGSAGLSQAITDAVWGDIIELPAGGISASVTIPAGVTLRGRGWNSVLNGTLTLASGAAAEHLRVYQSVNSSDDIIGIIGPSSGEATIRDVQVSLTQAGAGKAAGLVSSGGTLRAYECEVWVNGAAGSAWGYAAATGGVVEINQGQVKAWRTV